MLLLNLTTESRKTSHYLRRQALNGVRLTAKWSSARRMEMVEKLGGKCASPECLVPGGCVDIRALQIDHVNDDGKLDATRNRPAYMYRKVMSDTEGRFQLLCANCNVTKEYERRKREGRRSNPVVAQGSVN